MGLRYRVTLERPCCAGGEDALCEVLTPCTEIVCYKGGTSMHVSVNIPCTLIYNQSMYVEWPMH